MPDTTSTLVNRRRLREATIRRIVDHARWAFEVPSTVANVDVLTQLADALDTGVVSLRPASTSDKEAVSASAQPTGYLRP